jgi:GNAT superfamily N-acetyltransferase
MPLTLERASASDAPEIAAMRTRVADDLTQRFGHGHWSNASNERGVLFVMKRGAVYIARRRAAIIATLTLTRVKPWAIDKTYFTPVKSPLYLIAMSVAVELQRTGLGREAMTEADRLAREAKANAIRLDAYDTPAGAGPFYAGCGYTEMGRTTYRDVPLIYYERLL